MNNRVLWLTCPTPGCELKALDAMNNSSLWMTRATPSDELKAPDAITTQNCG